MPFTRAVGGGSFISAALLGKGLIQCGAQVLALFPAEGPATDVFRRHAVPYRILPQLITVLAYQRTGAEFVRLLKDFTATYWVASNFLRENKFDFVHLNDGTSVLPWGLAAKRRSIATIWHIRTGGAGYSDRLRLMVSDHIVCISRFVAARLPQYCDHFVLYNPAESTGLGTQDRVNQRKSFGLKPSDIHLIQIGRDAGYKRPDWSLAAFNRLCEHGLPAYLTFVGDFTSARQESLVGKVPVALRGRIRFTGWVNNPERLLASADFLLHPARGEHFGRIFAEAALCNVTFIATPTGAAPELVDDGLPGVLSKKDTEESYSNTVLNCALDRPSNGTRNFEPRWWLDPVQNARYFLASIARC